jgi:HEPN domain-containing protein
MADSNRHMDWIEFSKKDLNAAKVLMDNHCGNSFVAFHCQQAIEKSIKGYLLFHTQELIEGHSLVYLCKRASKINSKFINYIKDCAYTNQYYIETRYPADDPMVVTDEEAQECINIAAKILTYVEANIIT